MMFDHHVFFILMRNINMCTSGKINHGLCPTDALCAGGGEETLGAGEGRGGEAGLPEGPRRTGEGCLPGQRGHGPGEGPGRETSASDYTAQEGMQTAVVLADSSGSC